MVKTCTGCVDFSTCAKDQRAKLAGCKYHLEQNAYLTKEEEAPLNTCVTCKQMRCLTDGVICKKVEKLLPKPRSGGNTGEFPTDNIEQVWVKHVERESGWRKKPHIQDEIET